MKFLLLTTEAFGGHGGIAKYNRDILISLCELPEAELVTAFPRLMSQPAGAMPSNLNYVLGGLGSGSRYLTALAREVLGNLEYDVVVCGHINLLPLAYTLKLRRKDIPLILLIYGIDAWKPHRNFIINRLAAKVDAVISISETTRQRFLLWAKIPEERVHILPNAISIEEYGMGAKSQLLLERYGLNNKTVLMTLGRLSADERYKGIDEVLEVMPDMVRLNSRIVYLIAGDGTDRRRLEEKAASLGIKDHVVFVGFVQEQEKAEYYRLSDVFVMPGRGEGFGFVFLEAMACGVPVVASMLDGSREAVRDGKLGILVNPDNREELKTGILEAMARPREVPQGLEYFSFENFKERLIKIVSQVTLDGNC